MRPGVAAEQPSGEEPTASAGAAPGAEGETGTPSLGEFFAGCSQLFGDGRAYAATVKDLALAEARVSMLATVRVLVLGVVGWSLGTATLMMLSVLVAYLIAVTLAAGWLLGLIGALVVDVLLLAGLGVLVLRYLRYVGFRRSRAALRRADYPAATSGAASS